MNKAESVKHFYNTFPDKDKLSYSEFKKILNTFDSKMSKAVSEGLQIKTYIGTFKVQRNLKDLRISTPNWKLSNEKKKEILARGGRPYHKINAPDGEEWLVYHQDKYVFKTIWLRSNRVKNLLFYKFHTYKTHRERVAESAKKEILDLV